jgi:hypothetical protein
LAPYNAFYGRLGLDLLCIWINPMLNFWDKPILLGSLASLEPGHLPPADFLLQVIPFACTELDPIANAIIPESYLEQLQGERVQMMTLKRYLLAIGEKKPELYARIVEQIKLKGDRWIQEKGYVQEIRWLERLEQLALQ